MKVILWPPEKSMEDVLVQAVRDGDVTTVKRCLENPDFDVNKAVCPIYRSPLAAAVACGKEEIVAVLLADRRIDVNATDSHGQTALRRANSSGDRAAKVRIVQALLAHPDIDTTIQDEGGIDALHSFMFTLEEVGT